MAERLDSNKEWIKVLGYFVIVGLGWILPAPDPITPVGVRVFFVFLAVVYGWTATGQVWPSLLSCIMFPLTGVVSMKEFIAMGWGSDAFYFMVLAFVLIKFLEQVGVSQFLAAWLMSRKFIQGHPWRLIFMIMLTAYIVCSLVNIFIGIFLVWEIVYNITKIVKHKPLDKFPTLMVFGVAMMGAMSLSAMPWGSNAIVNLAVYANLVGEPGNMIRYIVYTVPVGILSILAYLVLCKYVFRLDVTSLKEIKGNMIDSKDLVMTKAKKIAFLALSVFIVLLLIPSLLPKATLIYQVLNNLGVVGVIVFVFAALSLIKVDGENIFDFAALARGGIPWNMVAMTIIILAIGGCLMNPATGINAYLQQNLTPLLTSLSPFVFVIAITLITFVLTNFMINMVVVALLLPVVVNMSSVLGIHPEQISYLIMVVSTNAILTPVASAASVILFPNTEWIRTKDIYQYGAITALVITIIAFAVSYLFMGFLY